MYLFNNLSKEDTVTCATLSNCNKATGGQVSKGSCGNFYEILVVQGFHDAVGISMRHW